MKKEVLERLEEKARRVVETMAALREENQRLSRQLEDAGPDREDDGRKRLEQEVRLLRDEREAMRERVENLIHLLEGSI